jgi:ribosomal protein RSM22 (predicted rRNA methylase)
MLPPELEQAIARALASTEPRALASAARRLTERYQRGEFALALREPADRAAYLAVRFPATFAASRNVFGHVRERLPQARFASLLDLGAGAGAASWAAASALGVERITCVEHNLPFAELGQRLAATSGNEPLARAHWLPRDIARVHDLPAHDVVVLSYVLGEIGEPHVADLIDAAWHKAGALMVVVEPGTPDGFRRLHRVRAQLLAARAHILAPCPHHDTCPMFATGDWCHFAARLARTAQHRRLKSASLGYEDEKFGYIVVAKWPVGRPQSRVLRHPLIHPGHLRLLLCRAERPEQRTVTKAQKPLWRYARQLGWGDAWEPPSEAERT